MYKKERNKQEEKSGQFVFVSFLKGEINFVFRVKKENLNLIVFCCIVGGATTFCSSATINVEQICSKKIRIEENLILFLFFRRWWWDHSSQTDKKEEAHTKCYDMKLLFIWMSVYCSKFVYRENTDKQMI